MYRWVLAIALLVAAAPGLAAAEKVSVECLQIEVPKGWSKAEDRFGGIVLSAPKSEKSRDVSFHQTISIEAQPAESLDSVAWMKRLAGQYEDKRVRQKAAGKPAPKAKVKSTRVAGQKGHAWRIDSETAIEGKAVDWRLISQTVVYKGMFYQVEVEGGRSKRLDGVAKKTFRSLRFAKDCAAD